MIKRERPAIFYGWWIVAAGFLIWLLMGGFISLGFTAFFEPIAAEFGWSYVQISLAASFRGAELGLLAPLIGLLIDRWGPRRLVFASIIMVAAGMVLLSRTTSLGIFYASFVLIAIGMSSNSPTVVFTTVAHWFHKRLGLATAITGSGFALGGLMVPLVVKAIDLFGWHAALQVLALVILVLCLPLSLLFRHKPEAYGYLPDNALQPPAAAPDTATPAWNADPELTTRQATGSRAFWHISVAMMLQYVAIGTLMVHIMPHLSSLGMPREAASLIAMAVPISSIAGRFISGWLVDRFPRKRIALVFFSAMLLGLLCLSYAAADSSLLLPGFFILFGMGWGSNHTLRTAMLREHFGRRNFGAIFGLTMGVSALGSIFGPLFAGWVFDTWASYHAAWLTLAALIFLGTVIIGTTPPPGASRAA